MNNKYIEKSESISSEFSKNGFILLKNVFSEEHCDLLRTQIFNKFNELKTINPK
jgi:hypothetical protein